MKINLTKLLSENRKNKKATPAFNCSSIEAIRGVLEASAEENYPVILETSLGEAAHLTPEGFVGASEEIGSFLGADFALHLDRAYDVDLIIRALEAGYNSISAELRIDDFEENIAKTKEIRELTDKFEANLEGVVDVVPLVYYKTTDKRNLSEVEKIKEFVQRTESDCVVVSIGTQSGKFKNLDDIKYDIIDKCSELLPTTPFVLHGGSYMPKDMLHSLIQRGFCKVNINSELRMAYSEKLKLNLKQNPEEYKPYGILEGVKDEVKRVAIEKIRLFK